MVRAFANQDRSIGNPVAEKQVLQYCPDNYDDGKKRHGQGDSDEQVALEGKNNDRQWCQRLCGVLDEYLNNTAYVEDRGKR